MNAELHNITQSNAYKEIQAQEPAYLCNVVVDISETTTTTYGFYQPKANKIHTFTANPVKITYASEPVQPNPPQLTIPDTIIAVEDIIGQAHQHLQEKYPTEQVLKQLVILQQTTALVWQYIALTKSMQTIAIQFDALTGRLLQESKEQFMQMMPGDKA